MSSIHVLTPNTLQSHEEAFCKYYQWLIRWALQFTGNDREKADELVQEVFAQLIFAHTDLSAIQNVPGYLYSTLHNTHVSQVRLAARSHTQSLSIVDYNLADTALHASDPAVHYQTQEELRRVCQYACARKQSSRAGSVLILRFFHSYHISEVARVVGCSPEAVRQALRFARNEARLFLENPTALSFIHQSQLTKLNSFGNARNAAELLSDLRRVVFHSCHDDCLSVDSLRSLYQTKSNLRPSNSRVAHLVSCRNCLDLVNRTLGIPLLAERFGENNSEGDNNSWPTATGGGKHSEKGSRTLREAKARPLNRSLVLRFRRRARELFEYYPRELRVSVNGHLLGSHSVNSELSRMRLDITLAEPIRFLEVMTEENTRLLMMSIDPPPNGDPRQIRQVELSDDRALEATLQYGHPWPMLEVVYHNPNFEADSVQIPEFAEPSRVSLIRADSAVQELPNNELPTASHDNLTRETEIRFREGFSNKKKQFARWLGSWTTMFRSGFPHAINPGVVTAILSAVLIGALLFVWLNVKPASSNRASDLLYQARIAETAIVPRADEALHRVLTLEQKDYPSGELISKSQIDLWKDVTGKSSRRVYDEKSQLIAGEWVKNNEPQRNHAQPSRMIYTRGQKPRFESSVANARAAISNLEVWRLEPSVSDFGELIAKTELAQVTETADFFVITYSAPQDQGDSVVLAATLRLKRPDLHAEETTFVLKRNGHAIEYRLRETNFERRPATSIPPKVFEPEADLFGTGGVTGRNEKGLNHPSAHLPVALSSPTASSELEVEVAFLLDRFRTRYGDQISLTRTGKGTLFVQAIVDTDEAKAEVLQALSAVAKNPAVNFDVSTATEVLQRQQRNRSNEPIVRQFSGSDNRMPAYEELHKYFDPQSSTDDATDRAIRTFAVQVVGRSRRVLSHAIELKQLKDRFTAGTLGVLSSDAKNKYFGMLARHSEAIRDESVILIEQLTPIFFVSKNVEKQEAIDIQSEQELAIAIERVYKSAIANDEIIRSVFSASSGHSETTAIKDPRFRVTLGTVQNLSERIRHAASTRQ